MQENEEQNAHNLSTHMLGSSIMLKAESDHHAASILRLDSPAKVDGTKPELHLKMNKLRDQYFSQGDKIELPPINNSIKKSIPTDPDLEVLPQAKVSDKKEHQAKAYSDRNRDQEMHRVRD